MNYGPATGFSGIKNRIILNDDKYAISLNTPVIFGDYYGYADSYEIESGKYTLTSYRLADDETPSTDDNNSTVSGIINNIIKNPQTNSIIIIIVFVVLILSISIISYFIYKKKIKKEEIK